jgi:GDP-4-dehydro-6-deoxy-D-mannose reductase
MSKLEELLIDPSRLDEYLARFPDYEREMEMDLATPTFWKGKRAFITGITGFAGGHLAEKLVELGAEVSGLVRRRSVPERSTLPQAPSDIRLLEGNLTDIDSVLSAFESTRPNVVFHLGAQSFVPTSFRAPIETYETNMLGTANVLEAAKRVRDDLLAIQVACSSEEYGKVLPEEIPITEANPLRPQSPYAVSKVAAEMMAKVHHEAHGLPTRITRAFNHTGPRRGVQFVTTVVTKQMILIKQGKAKKVVIGNPKPVRDFTDVRDVVQGYLLAVERGRDATPYNLGHGLGISIENLVKLAANALGLEKVEVEIDRSRFRPADVPILIADYSLAKSELGYRPRIPLTRSIVDNARHLESHPWLLEIEAH